MRPSAAWPSSPAFQALEHGPLGTEHRHHPHHNGAFPLHTVECASAKPWGRSLPTASIGPPRRRRRADADQLADFRSRLVRHGVELHRPDVVRH